MTDPTRPGPTADRIAELEREIARKNWRLIELRAELARLREKRVFERHGLEPPATSPGPQDVRGDGFTELRQANVARNTEWTKGNTVALSPSFRGNELAGEVGEACNVLKKIEREQLGLVGSRATVEQLAEELADIVICADLTAMDFGIELFPAVREKFNATSDARGLCTKLPALAQSDAQPITWRETLLEALRFLDKIDHEASAQYATLAARKICDVLDTSPPRPDASDAQPVGWQWRDTHGDWIDCHENEGKWRTAHYEVRPLYTTPPSLLEGARRERASDLEK